MNYFKRKFNEFIESIDNKLNSIKEKDLQQNEMNILQNLYYYQGQKLTTDESILLYHKIEKSFKEEIKNRKLSANEEIEIIKKFDNNL